MIFSWVDGFKLSVKVEDGTVVISGNKEGLLSLANHIATLADEEGNDHFHLDEHNSLEEGSAELIVEKVD
ncbi:MAG: hypothetical protein IIY25_01125 [Erysipelotrichaceae bacterium]|nr:hypothetical protein [Erysipelotrichaceae bacterium]